MSSNRGLARDIYNAAYLNLACAIASNNIDRARDFALAFPDNPAFTEICLEGVAKAFAEADVSDAFETFVSMEKGRFKEILGIALAKEEANSSPERAIEIASSLDRESRMDVIVHTAGLWADSNPSSFVEYIDGIPDAESRDVLLTTLAKHWSRYDQVGAMDWFDDVLAKSTVSPKGTAEEARMVFENSKVASSIAMNLFEIDAQRGGDWLKKLEDGPIRDHVLTNVIMNRLVPNNEEAFDMAMSFGSSKKRIEYGSNILKEIAAKDPRRAEDLVRIAGLSHQEASALMKAIR